MTPINEVIITDVIQKIKRIARQTQINSLKEPLEKITLKPDSVNTKNC